MTDRKSTYHPDPTPPQTVLPAGACDTHCHVFGPPEKFPFSPTAKYLPGDAPKERLFALHNMLGIERSVVVQASCHGYDNSAVADVIASRPGRYLGVALLPHDVDDETLAWHAAMGFRAVRFNFVPHIATPTPVADVVALSYRLAEHGMHLQIHLFGDLLEEIGTGLKDAATPVVIDHMARVKAADGPDQPAFQCLRGLMQIEKFWVKVSCAERMSSQGWPWRDGVDLAAALVREFPDRVLWGTDWPHPNFGGPPPDDGQLVDLLPGIVPDAAAMQALLVDNPQRLFGFSHIA